MFIDAFLNVLSVIGSILFMVFFFGFCVFIHELGHFVAGKLCGLKVLAFSIGFRKIWEKKINGVAYRIGWLPFGGYVDLPQIDANGIPKDEDGNELPRAEPWKRIVTAFAGPACNILFGFFLACFIWYFGLPQETPKLREFTVKTVETGSPEAKAGLCAGDRIVKLNGQPFHKTWTEFTGDVMLHVGDISLEVLRAGEKAPLTIVYQPAINEKFNPVEKIPYPFFRPEIPVILYPDKNSSAYREGLRNGDRVLKAAGKDVIDYDQVFDAMLYSEGNPIELLVQRPDKSEPVSVLLTPKKISNGWLMLGITFSPGSHLPVVERTIPGMPAEGLLKPRDRIVSVNGAEVDSSDAITAATRKGEGAEMTLGILRDGNPVEIKITPKHFTPYALDGVRFLFRNHPTPVEQFNTVVVMTWRALKSVTAGVKKRLGLSEEHSVLSPRNFSGPVGIGKYLYLSVYKGSLILGLNLVVVITFNLGLLNLLPIPVLDGGHILLALFEMLLGKPVPAKLVQPIMIFFVVFLVSFMLLVTYYDVEKLFLGARKKIPEKTEQTDESEPAGKTEPNASPDDPEKTEQAHASGPLPLVPQKAEPAAPEGSNHEPAPKLLPAN